METTKRAPGSWQLLIVAFSTAVTLIHPGAMAGGGAMGISAAATHAQAVRELRSPAVVMSIALEPGDEDLATLASLRFHEGARVYSVYVTDGAATLSDLTGESPMLLAGQRRDEACRASAVIDAEPYFLNLPDIGVVDDSTRLLGYWLPDSLDAKLTRALQSCQPDIILLNRDFRGAAGSTLRQSVLVSALERAMRKSRGAGKGAGPNGENAWSVQRLFVDRGDASGGVFIDADKEDPSLDKSYREIARDASSCYETLRAAMGKRMHAANRRYALAYPGGSAAPRTFLEGVPATGPRVRGMLKAALAAVQASSSQALPLVSQSIDEVQYLLIHERASLSPVEVRVCAYVKNLLEDARCKLLHVRIEYSASDSLLTERQVFYLIFSELKAPKGATNMEIIFPKAMDKSWWVNQTDDYRFPLNEPQQFTILSPVKMEYNTPASVYGIRSELPRVGFPFIVFHPDSVRKKNFAFRGEIRFQTGPRRALEILTPVVRASPGEVLQYSMLNISRNSFRGTIEIQDSNVSAGPKQMRLPRKDFVLSDTLALHWSEGLADGDYNVNVRINGEKVAWFTARKFAALADTSMPVGLYTGMRSSQIEAALRRLHVPSILLDSAMLTASSLTGLRSIVIDREALTLRRDASQTASLLLSWVRGGGHLLVLPQFELAGDSLLEGVGFSQWPALDPGAIVRVDSASVLMRMPNVIREGDWEGWVVARAFGSLRVPERDGTTVLVRAGTTGAPLVAAVPSGKGEIVAVALDLASQLMNVNPGTYRILANLIRKSER